MSPTRTVALDRMTQALEAAKRARDRGADVHEARRLLKEARTAFERGDYATAMARADALLAQFGSFSGETPVIMGPPAAPHAPVATDIGLAAGRLAEATETVKQAKARGFNVQFAKATLKQAKRAFKARDYQAAITFASQAIELSGSSGRVRP